MINRQIIVNDLLQVCAVVCNSITLYFREINNKLLAVCCRSID